MEHDEIRHEQLQEKRQQQFEATEKREILNSKSDASANSPEKARRRQRPGERARHP